MNCKMTGNIGGQTVRCDLREGHGGNHHAVVEATREMQIETERDELHEHAEELSEALAVERAEHGATRRLLGLARAEAAEWQRKVAEAEAALNGHLVGVEDRSPEEQDAAMAPWRADPPTAEPGEHDATLSEWHARRAPDVLERMRKAGAI